MFFRKELIKLINENIKMMIGNNKKEAYLIDDKTLYNPVNIL